LLVLYQKKVIVLYFSVESISFSIQLISLFIITDVLTSAKFISHHYTSYTVTFPRAECFWV